MSNEPLSSPDEFFAIAQFAYRDMLRGKAYVYHLYRNEVATYCGALRYKTLDSTSINAAGRLCGVCLSKKEARLDLTPAERERDRRLKKRYDLSLDDYTALLVRQEGRCAICRCKPRTQRLMVDHDHFAGPSAVRGLLCYLPVQPSRPRWRSGRHRHLACSR